MNPGALEQPPELIIDPCVGVDAAAVRTLLALQMSDGRASHPLARIAVSVGCADQAQEIRIEPWASMGLGGVRTFELPAADESVPATQEARSRELALAIAELIRRLELTHPLPTPAPPSPPPPVVTAGPAPPQASPEQPVPGRWQLGVLSAFEHFDGGQNLGGLDLVAARRIGRFLACELRAGARAGEDVTLPWVQITTRATTASAAVGAARWTRRGRLGGALMGRAQAFFAQFQVEPASGGPSATGHYVFVLAAEPDLYVALSRHVALAASGAAGVAVHGIVLRTQGTPTNSLSGAMLSANLGAVLTF